VGFQEDPFVPVDPSVFESIKAFYGMSADFEQGNFFGRSSIARKVRPCRLTFVTLN
jgi:hypothetical protein